MLNRYQSNPRIDNWKATKKSFKKSSSSKNYMLMYRKTNHLEVVGYLDSNLLDVLTMKSPLLDICFFSEKKQYHRKMLNNLSLPYPQ